MKYAAQILCNDIGSNDEGRGMGVLGGWLCRSYAGHTISTPFDAIKVELVRGEHLISMEHTLELCSFVFICCDVCLSENVWQVETYTKWVIFAFNVFTYIFVCIVFLFE